MEEMTAIRLLRAAQEVVQDARPATEHGLKDADLVVVDREYLEGLQAVVQEISDAAIRAIEEATRRPIHPPV